MNQFFKITFFLSLFLVQSSGMFAACPATWQDVGEYCYRILNFSTDAGRVRSVCAEAKSTMPVPRTSADISEIVAFMNTNNVAAAEMGVTNYPGNSTPYYLDTGESSPGSLWNPLPKPGQTSYCLFLANISQCVPVLAGTLTPAVCRQGKLSASKLPCAPFSTRSTFLPAKYVTPEAKNTGGTCLTRFSSTNQQDYIPLNYQPLEDLGYAFTVHVEGLTIPIYHFHELDYDPPFDVIAVGDDAKNNLTRRTYYDLVGIVGFALANANSYSRTTYLNWRLGGIGKPLEGIITAAKSFTENPNQRCNQVYIKNLATLFLPNTTTDGNYCVVSSTSTTTVFTSIGTTTTVAASSSKSNTFITTTSSQTTSTVALTSSSQISSTKAVSSTSTVSPMLTLSTSTSPLFSLIQTTTNLTPTRPTSTQTSLTTIHIPTLVPYATSAAGSTDITISFHVTTICPLTSSTKTTVATTLKTSTVASTATAKSASSSTGTNYVSTAASLPWTLIATVPTSTAIESNLLTTSLSLLLSSSKPVDGPTLTTRWASSLSTTIATTTRLTETTNGEAIVGIVDPVASPSVSITTRTIAQTSLSQVPSTKAVSPTSTVSLMLTLLISTSPLFSLTQTTTNLTSGLSTADPSTNPSRVTGQLTAAANLVSIESLAQSTSLIPSKNTNKIVPSLQEYLNTLKKTNDILSRTSSLRALLPYLIMPVSSSDSSVLGMQWSSLFVKCFYDEVSCLIEKDFKTDFTSTYGSCYTFNHNASNIRISYSAGRSHGLKLVLENIQDEYICTSESAGFVLSLQDQSEDPFPETMGFYASPGVVTSFAITRSVILKSTNCVDQDDPTTYYYNGSYTVEGCLRACYQQYALESCACADPRFAKPANSNYCTVNDINCLEMLLTCSDIDILQETNCDCKEPCRYVAYGVTRTMAEINIKNPVLIHACRTLKSNTTNSTSCADQFKKNFAYLEIYYGQLIDIDYKEVSAYPPLIFLMDAANYLGLYFNVGAFLFFEVVALLFGVLFHTCFNLK